jgi:OOP family OmpA-OmpF porin
MRTNVARALGTGAVLAAMAGLALAGCKASVKVGEAPPPPKKVEAPPPPEPKKEAPPPPEEPKKAGRQVTVKLPTVAADGTVELPGPVMFETGTAKLKPESDAVLELVFNYMKVKTDVGKLRIEGHTDTDGPDAKNQTLSEERALSVSAWLVGKGTDCKRLVPVGFGETRLIAKPEKTEEDKAKNRRVMFVNAEVGGKPMGGLPVDGGGKALDACKK